MSGSVQINSGSESDLEAAVANVGPVAVAIDGESNAFRVSGPVTAYIMDFNTSLSLSLCGPYSSITVECTTPPDVLVAVSTTPW